MGGHWLEPGELTNSYTTEESDAPPPTAVSCQTSISMGGVSWGEMTEPSLDPYLHIPLGMHGS